MYYFYNLMHKSLDAGRDSGGYLNIEDVADVEIVTEAQFDAMPEEARGLFWPVHDSEGPSTQPVSCDTADEARGRILASENQFRYEQYNDL